MIEIFGRIHCLKLWRIWNFFILLFLYIYLLYDSIFRYVSFKKSSMDVAFGSNFSPNIMNIYLMSIIGGLSSIIISFYCLVYQYSNYGDNGTKLGRDTNNILIYKDAQDEENDIEHLTLNKKIRFIKRMLRHAPPLSCLFHYISALCFLLPLPFVEAHQIRQRVLTSNNLWHTDLDFLFDPDTWHIQFVVDNPSINWFLRPQYFNLILCLGTFSVRYASVFWSCHKGFSFIFSLLMMLHSIHVLLDYSTTSILIRVAYNPDFISKNLRITYLSPSCFMFFSIFGSSIILISFWSVFEFGFQQFMDTLSRYRHIVMMQSDNLNVGNNIYEINYNKRKHSWLRRHLPHLSAIGAGIIGLGIKIPLFLAGMDNIYKYTGDPIIMANLLISILFICVWFIAWFGFSLKPTWRFTISNCSKNLSDISSTTTIVQQPRLQSVEPINQVYSCFHNLDHRMEITDSNYQNRLRNRDYFPEETDLNSTAGCTNYVYLQSAMNPNLNQRIIPQQLGNDIPIIGTFLNNSDNKHNICESESSYDSATNIRNQLLSSIDYQVGRCQSQTVRNFGVLKYSGDNGKSQISEYIPLQSEPTCGPSIIFENCSSPETSTLHAAESDATLRSNVGSQQFINNLVSLNQENANKKRTFGQRVTFKDDQSNDIIDCSPNNSEKSSNNTSSSDSGIDSNSKQHCNFQNIQPHNIFDESNDVTRKISRSSGNATNSTTYSGPSINTAQFLFHELNSNHTLISSHSQSCTTEEFMKNNTDDHSMSFISEDDQDQRLCSQV